METEAYQGVATRAAENLASPPAFSMMDRDPLQVVPQSVLARLTSS